MHFKKILITTDFSQDSFSTFDSVAYEQQMEGAEVTLLTVAEDWEVPPAFYGYLPDPKLIDEYREEHRARLERDLQELAEKHFHGQPVKPVVVVSSRSAAEEITSYAREHGADLIVIGSHGRGAVASLVLGSTAQKVIRNSPCPVLVIPREANA